MDTNTQRLLNISFMKSGSGSTTSRITLPISWIKKMGLTSDNKAVNVIFDEESKTIIIKPNEFIK
ncbi:MAG: AbrB/MazE/SpoVT family DNA-binding domain-containing protein [Cetobacterium sp.]